MKTFKQFIESEVDHPMIEVDGKLKHRNNSRGMPIHSTDEGIRNFHRWFGNSRTVDEHGRPQVMYHGTSSYIPKFDLSYTGKNNDQFGSGFYLTNDPEKASYYSFVSSEYDHDDKHPKSPNVIPTYVSIKKPLNMNSETPLSRSHVHALITSAPNHIESLYNFGDVPKEGYSRVLKTVLDAYSSLPAFRAMNALHNDFYDGHSEDFMKNFKRITKHDGIIIDDGKVVNAFAPNQIKSVTGNQGNFSKRKDGITESSIDEDYHSLVKSSITKQHFPIFVNPDKSEIKELANQTNLVRFIAHDGKFYLFNGNLLHADAIKQLGLPISNNPKLKDAFLGIAKASTNGTMEFYDTNQTLDSDASRINELYPQLKKYMQ